MNGPPGGSPVRVMAAFPKRTIVFVEFDGVDSDYLRQADPAPGWRWTESEVSLEGSWNIGSIGISGPALRGPSASRLFVEPPLSPPVSPGAGPTGSVQPFEPPAPFGEGSASSTPSVFDAGPASPDQPAKPTASLESLLMRFRLITSDQLEQALREKAETGKDVGAIVVERGWVNEDQLTRLLSYAPALTTDAAVASPPAGLESTPAPEPEVEPVAEAPAEPVTEPEPAETAADVVSEPTPFETRQMVPALHAIPPALELVEETEAVSEPAPELEAQPEAEPEPEPVTPPAPVFAAFAPAFGPISTDREPITAEPEPAVAEPEPPAADAAPAIELESAPEVAVEAAVEPEPAPAESEPAEEPQVVRFVEPDPIETIARVFVRLSSGERVEAGTFDDIAAAKARAEEVVRHVSGADEGWPFFGGRFIRPEAIVSVDVDATVVRYA